MYILNSVAVTMADESDDVLVKAVVWLQKKQESMKDGFSIDYKGSEYTFFPTYLDRYCIYSVLKSFGHTQS